MGRGSELARGMAEEQRGRERKPKKGVPDYPAEPRDEDFERVTVDFSKLLEAAEGRLQKFERRAAGERQVKSRDAFQQLAQMDIMLHELDEQLAASGKYFNKGNLGEAENIAELEAYWRGMQDRIRKIGERITTWREELEQEERVIKNLREILSGLDLIDGVILDITTSAVALDTPDDTLECIIPALCEKYKALGADFRKGREKYGDVPTLVEAFTAVHEHLRAVDRSLQLFQAAAKKNAERRALATGGKKKAG